MSRQNRPCFQRRILECQGSEADGGLGPHSRADEEAKGHELCDQLTASGPTRHKPCIHPGRLLHDCESRACVVPVELDSRALAE